jgi:hypothetical protein
VSVQNNIIGDRGESIFFTEMTKLRPSIFWPHFIGAKGPYVDFIVFLRNSRYNSFFLAQVKTTSLGLRNGRLPISVPRPTRLALRAFRVPTYLAAVDDRPGSEAVYLTSPKAPIRRGRPGVSTKLILDDQALKDLWTEVETHWSHCVLHLKSSFFESRRR